MVDFNFKSGSFPMEAVINAAQRKAQLEEQSRTQGNQSIVQGLQAIGGIGQSLVDQRLKVAQALALGKQFNIPENQARLMTPEQVLDTGKAMMPTQQIIITTDSSGNPTGQQTIKIPPKGKVSIIKPTNATRPQQSQYVDPTDGQPLNFTNGKYTRADSGAASNGVPVLKKGDESAIGDANLISQQMPNIKPMFDAYRTSKSPQLLATPIGRLMNPVGKQAESALKLAAFSFGGKNLTGQEKDVVFGALFPSITDNQASLDQKEKLLTEFMAGKINLLEASNLLGPAGAPLKSMLAAKQAQGGVHKAQVPVQTNAAPVAQKTSDLVHLSTKELMNLKKQMTAHKEKENVSKS